MRQVEPAVKLSADAARIAQTCKDIAEEATELLSKFEKISTYSIQALKEEASASISEAAGHAHLAIEGMEHSLTAQLASLKTIVTTITEEASDAMEVAKKAHDEHVFSTKSQLNAFGKSVEEKLHDELSNLKKTIEIEILEYKKLVEAAERLVSKINSIDFPQRLDKLDANVSAINIGIQNIQTRLENIERNLKDEIRENQQAVNQVKTRLEEFAASWQAKGLWLIILLIINGLLVIGVLVFLFFK
ncbi:MAG: hypothetical protein AAB316_05445 [Bacteroidota bacterium]